MPLPRVGVVATASNIRGGKNPEYTVADFRRIMPAFTEEIVPDTIVEHFLKMADAVVQKARWHELWLEGMRLYIAHFVTLYLSTQPTGEGLPALMSASGTQGIATSKTVGAVSVAYDIGSIANDLTGWGDWKQTVYGTQFATLARMVGMGGMYVR
ncbi:hypothetical protein FACS1894184_16360 [Clostridia bacterium]|nr:hypothetical protein FACS1894184_16360 [Clostridia bacterium]